jgi:hypothetical protein
MITVTVTSEPIEGIPPEAWEAAQTSAAEVMLRCAVSISPVVTGAYRGAHTIVQEGDKAILTIDQRAINPQSGVPVTRYAAAVEARHQVYGRTASEAGMRAATEGAEELVRRLG